MSYLAQNIRNAQRRAEAIARIAELEARLATAETLLREARDTIDTLGMQGDFGNGVTDATGTIDEGEVKAADLIRSTAARITAFLDGAKP